MGSFVIPFSNAPNQTTTITTEINLENRTFIIELSYMDLLGYWSMSILNYQTKEYYLSNVPLVTGEYPVANILGPYRYLLIGSVYILKVSDDIQLDYPDKDTFGSDFIIVWGDNIDKDIEEPG